MDDGTELTRLLAEANALHEATPEFSAALAEAQLWLPVGPTQPGDPEAQRLLMVSAGGASYIPAFTTRALLYELNPQAQSICQSFQWVVDQLPDDIGVVINPGAASTIGLSREQALAFLPPAD